MRRIMFLALLLLAACATPQQACIYRAGNDIRVMDKLIAKTEGNISRGYGLRAETYFINQRQVCGRVDDKKVYCDVPVASSREVPVAIDLNVEKAKLASLVAKRKELAKRSAAIIAECKLAHPEA
ncbi:MAG: hypothetical protein KUG69_02345 [Marinosulfonomonas sp.]|nr:hypothetical protein [Marinosulfonomonas sp.]